MEDVEERKKIEEAVRFTMHKVGQQVAADEARPKEVKDKEKKEKKEALEAQVDRKKLWRIGLGQGWSWTSALYYIFAYSTIIYFTYRILWFILGIWNCATQPEHCYLFGYTPFQGMEWQRQMGYGPKAAPAEL